MTEKKSRQIQSLARGLALVAAVGDADRPLSLADLNAVLPIDRSSVFRLANTLKMQGFLTQLPDTRHYTLGPMIWRLAGQMRASNPLPQLARAHVVGLTRETGETAHLAIRRGDRAVFVDHQLTAQVVGVSTRPGRSEPLHATALGKALLADCDRQVLEEVLGPGPLPTATSQTIRSITALVEECEQTRQRGFAIDDEEFHPGVRCVAAPIRDLYAEIVAAIGISAPASRLAAPQVPVVADQVMRHAREISLQLGYLPPPGAPAAESPGQQPGQRG